MCFTLINVNTHLYSCIYNSMQELKIGSYTYTKYNYISTIIILNSQPHMLLAGLAATILSSKTLNREHCHGVH